MSIDQKLLQKNETIDHLAENRKPCLTALGMNEKEINGFTHDYKIVLDTMLAESQANAGSIQEILKTLIHTANDACSLANLDKTLIGSTLKIASMVLEINDALCQRIAENENISAIISGTIGDVSKVGDLFTLITGKDYGT
jgi:hypothetical protein